MTILTIPSDDKILDRPSSKRIHAIDSHPPYWTLKNKLTKKSKNPSATKNVLHWFRNKDLRIEDNIALYEAYQKAQSSHTYLTTTYLYCPTSLIRQGISTAKLDFILETLSSLKKQLAELNIPLVILPIDQLSDSATTLWSFAQSNNLSHVYANYEYEVDELHRDIQVVEKLSDTVHCAYYQDQCIFEPGTVLNQQKKPLQVFTPFYKKWLYDFNQPSTSFEPRASLQKQSIPPEHPYQKLWNTPIPTAPKEKSFENQTVRDSIREQWPVGYSEALKKLNHFIDNHLEDYHHTRSQPSLNSSSKLSPYLAIGAISMRSIFKRLQTYLKNSNGTITASSNTGLMSWVRELVFREFYRQQLVIKPHVSMNTPANPRFTCVEWEKDEMGWKKWCAGQTGFPWIDAGMRQLKQEAYMHNRLRMNVASYLYHHLLIDYRRGERYFAEQLIDLDLANNIQGWSPSYTIFNPLLQSEKNDPNGDYIRQWVPELRSVKGKAIFDPYHRLSKEAFEKLGYPKPHINLEISKNRARTRFKQLK